MRFISMGAHKLSMSSIFLTVWFFTVWNLTDYLAILLLKSIWIVSGLRILFSSFFWDITDIHCLNLRTTTQWFHNVYIAMYVLQNDGLGILLTMWPRPFLYTHSGPSACDFLWVLYQEGTSLVKGLCIFTFYVKLLQNFVLLCFPISSF